jgi:hypothetical protein
MNAMIYTRSHKDDYNEFGKENQGWAWETVLPCKILINQDFKKLEKLNKKLPEKYNSQTGLLEANEQVEPHHSVKLLKDSIIATGFKDNSDVYLSGETLGSFIHKIKEYQYLMYHRKMDKDFQLQMVI